MDQELLEDILNCPTLPSLPAVAVEVIELTRDPEVKLERLAQTIQNDQGLSSKVLRTVNSSYYGLRKKCATIRQSLVVLGLSSVKSLALGFSLVSSVDRSKSGFDYNDYWRRGLFTAVAARSISKTAGKEFQDEAFLAGLLHDIGMVAMFEAMGPRYAAIVEQTGGDHRKLCKFELSALELQHPDIGAMMAQRWKLPDELVLPVKYHERPSAGPSGEIGELVRAVGLGGILADAMMSDEPLTHLKRFGAKAKDWFGLDSQQVDAIVAEVKAGVREMASLFDIDAGVIPDMDQLLAQARDQAVNLAIEKPVAPASEEAFDALLLDSPRYDAVTGLINEKVFPKLYSTAFEESVAGGEPMSMIRVMVDQGAGSEQPRTVDLNKLLVGVATMLRKHFEHRGAIIARLGPMSFAVAISAGRGVVTRGAEAFRVEIESAAASWGIPAAVSIGIATRDEATTSIYDRPAILQAAAAQALKAAGASGGNCVRFFTPRKAA